MKTSIRRKHTRTNSNGTTFNVSSHIVHHTASGNTHNSNNQKHHSPGFLTPNAKCPVCNEHVFYYQNESGSRVFFDTVWPHWDKHPCTDNGNIHVNISTNKPNINSSHSAEKIKDKDLRIGKISHIYKNNTTLHLIAEPADKHFSAALLLRCQNNDIGLNQGDLIFIENQQMHFIDTHKLRPMVLRVDEFKTNNDFFRSLGLNTNLEEMHAIKRQALWPFPK